MIRSGVRAALGDRLAAATSVFQPLVELASGAVVGFEALTRGAPDDPSPVRLLQAAHAAGRLVEFDDACRARSVAAAAASGLPDVLTWFVNTEAAGLARPGAEILADDGGLNIAIEITERALSNSPRALMRIADDVHERGWLLALDDVGAEPESLALLPLIGPDVVKLDMSVTHRHCSPEAIAVAKAVRAYADETGAVVLAEGIETERHRDIALANGATHGQGYWFGRPGPLPARITGPHASVDGRRSAVHTVPDATPFEIAVATHPAETVTKKSLVAVSRQIEHLALRAEASSVMLVSVQHVKHWTPAMHQLYSQLVQHSVFTGVAGIDIPADLQPGVRGSTIAPDHPLAQEWNVISVGPHHATALTAHDLGDLTVDGERRFRHVVTDDRNLVTAMARSLFRHLAEHVDHPDTASTWR